MVDEGRAGDPFELERFVVAQDEGGTYRRALAELRSGRKLSHWMWFVFPQIAGLGLSETSRRYAISSIEEAHAYLAHPLLGARLREAADLAATSGARSADQLLGWVDARKLCSSMTLFLEASPDEEVFRSVLDRYFAGRVDEMTLQMLRG